MVALGIRRIEISRALHHLDAAVELPRSVIDTGERTIDTDVRWLELTGSRQRRFGFANAPRLS